MIDVHLEWRKWNHHSRSKHIYRFILRKGCPVLLLKSWSRLLLAGILAVCNEDRRVCEIPQHMGNQRFLSGATSWCLNRLKRTSKADETVPSLPKRWACSRLWLRTESEVHRIEFHTNCILIRCPAIGHFVVDLPQVPKTLFHTCLFEPSLPLSMSCLWRFFQSFGTEAGLPHLRLTLYPRRLFTKHNEGGRSGDPVLTRRRDSSIWCSAVIKSQKEVGGETTSARLWGLLLHVARVVLVIQAYITSPSMWEIR